jgi:amino-acid N-acetyltransferase
MPAEPAPATRRATREELVRVNELLAQASLPALPAGIPLSNVVVATKQGEIVGAIALEVAGRQGLLRSAVVDPAHRGSHVGRRLVQTILARAAELGLRGIYLLSDGAADFFAHQGFARVTRDSVPPEIRATREFREQCPDSAEVMFLRLETLL